MKINHQIPKIIHYCWFGGNPLPEMAVKCIESWKKYCPDYEIIEWNESNFDVNCCDYIKEAYTTKKWAFVSDYIRFKVLYEHGGLYFDTDVELIKPIDDMIEQGPFMGSEGKKGVNPGLGLAAAPGLNIYGELIDFYNQKHFIKSDGEPDCTTVVEYTTKVLREKGWVPIPKIQCIEGVYIYPEEYFCPMDYITGKINITENTRSIHHYYASWHTPKEKKWHSFEQKVRRKYPGLNHDRLFKGIFWRIAKALYIYGFAGVLRKVQKKYKL